MGVDSCVKWGGGAAIIQYAGKIAKKCLAPPPIYFVGLCDRDGHVWWQVNNDIVLSTLKTIKLYLGSI